jgi:hypothetical protein
MKEEWQEKRENMQDVCSACHGMEFVKGHYFQMDGVVQLYNKKFAEPAGKIMTKIQERKLLEKPSRASGTTSSGRTGSSGIMRAAGAHGAAMMGPDFTWWHGIYEVSQHFY